MEYEFHIEKFISLIKSRNHIWNFRSSSYSDRNLRFSSWVEIAKEMVPDFEEKTKGDQSDTIAELQNKWKVLRDGFNRTYKNFKKSFGLGPIKKYAYYDDLLFLEHLYEAKYHLTKDAIGAGTSNCVNEDEPVQKPARKKQKRIEKKSTSEEATTIDLRDDGTEPAEKNDTINQKLNLKQRSAEDILIEKLMKRANEVLNNPTTSPTFAKQDETLKGPSDVFDFHAQDEDRLFLMSLLRDFNAIPKKHKLDAKFDIINVLRHYRNISSPAADARGCQSSQAFKSRIRATANSDPPVTTTVSLLQTPGENASYYVKDEGDIIIEEEDSELLNDY